VKRYDYDIDIDDLVPPIGGVFRYAAYVRYMVEIDGDKRQRLQISFGETHGETKQEASEKMETKVKKWIQQQQ
jgi:hypothetical protein